MESSLNMSDNQNATDEYLLSNGQRLARVILLPILVIVGVVGNLLVCIAVYRTPKLKKVVNYFIVSLAVSDLFVCTIVLPLAIHQEYNHLKWGLERWVCRLWVTLDVLLCTTSIWNLCLVSADRYLAVVKPNQYAKWRTPRNAIISICTVWIVGTLVAIMLQVSSQDTHLETCVVTSSDAVTVIGPLVAFYIPCIIILFLYWRIYITIKDYTLRRRPSTMSSNNSTDELSSTDTNVTVSRTPSSSKINSTYSEKGTLTKSWRQSSIEKPARGSSKRKWPLQRSVSTRSAASTFRKERKYAIVLAIVVLTFIGCWLPFFIVYLLQLCKCAANLALPEAFNATTWLGWCNSVINPMIYTVFNKDFRKAFKRTLFCGKFSEKNDDSSQNK